MGNLRIRFAAMMLCVAMCCCNITGNAKILVDGIETADIDYIGANPDTTDWFLYHVPEDLKSLAETPLDMSRFLKHGIDDYAGARGRVVADGDAFALKNADGNLEELRFWGTNLVGQTLFMRTDEDMEELIGAMKASGMNLARIHHFDEISMRPSIYGVWNIGDAVKIERTEEYLQSVRDYLPVNFHQEILDTAQPEDPENFKYPLVDPSAMNRFCYLWARLKEEGIYLNLTTIVNMFVAQGVGIMAPETIDSGYKIEGQFDRHLIALQKAAMYQFFNWKNPYTGTTLGSDPCVALVEVNNEGSLMAYTASGKYGIASEYYQGELRTLFNQWLLKRYETDAAVATAWQATGKTGLDNDESLADLSVRIPGDYLSAGYSQQRIYDTFWFLHETENSYHKEMIGYLRDVCGYDGLVTGSQPCMIRDLPVFYENSDFDYIDRHGYFSHPVALKPSPENLEMPYSEAPVSAKNTGAVGNYLFTWLSKTRVYNKPSMLSEWQFCEFNQFSGAGNFMMAAISSYQGWNSAQFCFFNGSLSEYGSNVAKSTQLGSFGMINHPFRMATLPVASMIFHRRDVDEAVRQCYYTHKTSGAYSALDPTNGYPYSVSNNGYAFMYGKTGIQFNDRDMCPEEVNDFTIQSDADRLTMPMVNENGEILWNTQRGTFLVNTKKTQGFSGFSDGNPVVLEDVRMELSNKYATVVLSSLEDDREIAESGHMLLSVATRTANPGQKLSEDGLTLTTAGDLSVILVEPLKGTITIKTDDDYAVYELDECGRRHGQVTVSKDDSGYTVLHLSEENQALNYEIVRTRQGTVKERLRFYDMEPYPERMATVVQAVDTGVIRPEAERVFCPDKELTRGETLGVVVRALGIEGDADQNYRDVALYNRDYDEIAAARSAGIVTDAANNTLDVFRAVTHKELGVYLYNYLSRYAITVQGMGRLADYELGGVCDDEAVDAISYLVRTGIFKDWDASKMQNGVTRLEMLDILENIYKYMTTVCGLIRPGYTLAAPENLGAAPEWRLYDTAEGENFSVVGTETTLLLRNQFGGKYISAAGQGSETSRIYVEYSLYDQYVDGFLTDGWKPTVPDNGAYRYLRNAPESNSFTYSYTKNGKRFTTSYSILDYISDGRVYVLCNQYYGYGLSYDTPAVVPQNRRLDPYNQNGTYGNMAYRLQSIAYQKQQPMWKDTLVIDDIMKTYIDAEAQWLTERAYNEAIEGLEPTIADDYVVHAPMGAMSVCEMVEYKGRYGYSASDEYAAAADQNLCWYLRTPYAGGSAGIAAQQYYVRETDTTYQEGSIGKIDAGAGYLAYRPSFYLNRDFFRHVRIDHGGKEVMAYIASLNTERELKDLGYGQEEIAQMSGLQSNGICVTVENLADGNDRPLETIPVGTQRIKAVLAINNFQYIQRSIIVLAAMYDSEQVLKGIALREVPVTGETLKRETIEFNFSAGTEPGDTVKVMAINDLQKTNPLMDSMDFFVLPGQ